jgi:RimJ/RimL family protein N-acetyltransferase
VLGLERIIAQALPDNTASMRVLEKVGFVRHDPIVCEGEPAEFFVLLADDYQTLNTG